MGSKNSWIVKLNSDLNRTEVEGLCADAQAANVTWHPESKRGLPLSIHPLSLPTAPPLKCHAAQTFVHGSPGVSQVGLCALRLACARSWQLLGCVTDAVELLRHHPGCLCAEEREQQREQSGDNSHFQKMCVQHASRFGIIAIETTDDAELDELRTVHAESIEYIQVPTPPPVHPP